MILFPFFGFRSLLKKTHLKSEKLWNVLCVRVSFTQISVLCTSHHHTIQQSRLTEHEEEKERKRISSRDGIPQCYMHI